MGNKNRKSDKQYMPANKISLQNAKEDKLFYFVANVVVYRESDGKCLILKRGEKEKVHPGKYCVPGGKLEWGQLDITRPTRLNGDVLDFEDAAKYKSGEIKIEDGAFVDYDWVNETEVKNYECIKGIQEEIAETIKIFRTT